MGSRSSLFAVFIFTTALTCAIVQGTNKDPSMVVAPGQIPTGGALRSKNGRYLLAMQYDCNLVLYDLGKNRLPLWATNTSGLGASCCATMQSDGNFVLLDGAHLIKFQTFTFIYSCTGGQYLAWLQDDGNFVVYCALVAGTLQQLSALWATGTDGW